MAIRRWIIVAYPIILAGCGGDSQAPARTDVEKPAAAVPGATVARKGSDWNTFNSEAGGFSILMPGTPQVSSQPGRLFTVNIVSCDHDGANFVVTYFDPPANAIAPEVVEATIKRDRDMSVQDIQGTLKSEEKVTIQKGGKDWPGLASVMGNDSSLYTSRLYAVGGRMYSLQVMHPKSQDLTADAKKFFDSFALAAK